MIITLLHNSHIICWPCAILRYSFFIKNNKLREISFFIDMLQFASFLYYIYYIRDNRYIYMIFNT